MAGDSRHLVLPEPRASQGVGCGGVAGIRRAGSTHRNWRQTRAVLEENSHKGQGARAASSL